MFTSPCDWLPTPDIKFNSFRSLLTIRFLFFFLSFFFLFDLQNLSSAVIYTCTGILWLCFLPFSSPLSDNSSLSLGIPFDLRSFRPQVAMDSNPTLCPEPITILCSTGVSVCSSTRRTNFASLLLWLNAHSDSQWPFDPQCAHVQTTFFLFFACSGTNATTYTPTHKCKQKEIAFIDEHSDETVNFLITYFRFLLFLLSIPFRVTWSPFLVTFESISRFDALCAFHFAMLLARVCFLLDSFTPWEVRQHFVAFGFVCSANGDCISWHTDD